ncbi:histone acetyltransferase NGG1 CYBJADRAFT_176755 [Cyberlindnera jadinii NRRL Y-1542]|uniref:NGG1 protein n=1 Tax=Cyberlindnera jadinii (strain ATCC 18201 / CBS 1600 / BCRC 20928 / JCM 3617 / NBRC 0987 / NRRL Y-1542) TaxID=983966 RepID=A0A1E4S513_CYBJN|nr:hypothetical protein CYBJADRAFT_176755 [Cyberlindnera jadinii NRRL Y-1542]ODV74591.1 hypothetical protein CYBJADRAFT_176755 [Cyberlindnera jadinii NRRL Y-1542]
MGTRNSGRRRGGSTTSGSSGKQAGKKTTKVSAPSTTLNEVLSLLSIQYDSDLGVLNGDFVTRAPELAVLTSLKKSLVKLSDQLEIASNNDESTIERMREKQRELTAGGDMDTEAEPGTKEATVEPEEEEGEMEESIKQEDGEEEKEVEEDSHDDDHNGDHDDDPVDGPVDDKNKLDTTTERKLSIERMENDPTVKNPKSEFVTSQTLPAAALALGLFNEEDGGLHETGEEYLKKRYGVASYPKTDLRDKLPGEIPDIDFSKSKPTNQVQFATFQTFFENFYRQFTDEDLKFLKGKYLIPDSLSSDPNYDPNITPYLIPDLGQLYAEIWNNEEGAINYTSPVEPITLDSIEPKMSSTDLTDETIDTESVSCGPLVSRLLSAIMKDESSDDEDETSNSNETRTSVTTLPDQPAWKVSSVNTDYTTLEDRLKRELKFIGIFTDLGNDSSKAQDGEDREPNWLKPEDDEVSTELRALQSELREVSKRNNKRKRILIPIIEQQLAWQEYNSILDDLEKQIDQTYMKRIRVPKNKKRKTAATSVPPSLQTQMQQQAAQQAAANAAVKSLLEKRQRWIDKIGPLFDTGDGIESLKKYPKESVFERENLDEDEDEDYEDGDDLVLQQDN